MEDVYATLAAKLTYPESARLQQILHLLMNQEEARLVAALPAPVAELSTKLGKPAGAIERMLAEIFQKGIIFMTSKGYQFARSVTQLHDSTGSDLRLDAIHGRKLLDLWFEFSEKEWFPNRALATQQQERPNWRIVPALRAIAPNSRIVPTEDLKAIVDKATRLATVHCPCRRAAQKCERPVEVCLQFNRAADYAISRSTGRELNKEEAMAVLEEAEEGGLVHAAPNESEVDRVICNCCPDCCVLFYPLIRYGGLDKGVAKSRFQAEVEQGLCTGCQDCTDRCHFEAIEMVRVAGEKRFKARVDPAKCYGCGLCAVGCEAQAIKLTEARPPQHIPTGQ